MNIREEEEDISFGLSMYSLVQRSHHIHRRGRRRPWPPRRARPTATRARARQVTDSSVSPQRWAGSKRFVRSCDDEKRSTSTHT